MSIVISSGVAPSVDRARPSPSVARGTGSSTGSEGRVSAAQNQSSAGSASGVVTTAQTAAGRNVDMEELRSAVNDVNRVIQKAAPGLEFTVDEESERPVVKVVDSQTREVLRQIPDEDMLRMSAAIDKMRGLLVRDVA